MIVAWVNEEDLIEPGGLEYGPHMVVQSAERELAAVFLHILERANQHSHSGAVDESNS